MVNCFLRSAIPVLSFNLFSESRYVMLVYAITPPPPLSLEGGIWRGEGDANHEIERLILAFTRFQSFNIMFYFLLIGWKEEYHFGNFIPTFCGC